MIGTEKWLGERHGAGITEEFPKGVLNEMQLRSLLSLHDNIYGFVTELHVGHCLRKLTEDGIVEVIVRVGHDKRGSRRQAVLWMDIKGEQIAAAILHPDTSLVPAGCQAQPGHATTWWRIPGTSKFQKAQEHNWPEGLWSIGLGGAINRTRQFIKDNYA